ncbi:MAG: hypothetical protein WKF97_06260 [Chitinophagaceae bacterium]
MFTSISWSEYITSVVVLLIIYYLIVGIKFYSHELRSVLSSKRKIPVRISSLQEDPEDDRTETSLGPDIQQELFSSHKKFMPCVEETEDTFEQVQELTARLKEVIAEAISKDFIKQEFMLSLQLCLRKYQYLKGSPFMVAINNLIASECEKHDYLLLTAEERVMLWNE